MDAAPASFWPKTTAASIFEIPQRPRIVEFYDDEETGMVSIYYSDKAGQKRWPCRTVNMTTQNGKHGKDVIDAWMSDADEIRDYRKSQQAA